MRYGLTFNLFYAWHDVTVQRPGLNMLSNMWISSQYVKCEAFVSSTPIFAGGL